jgi:hypothetical protein
MSEVLFGHPRIKGSLRLHEAFRSLARPSSAPEPSHSPDDYKSPKRQFDRRPALRMSRRSSTSQARGPRYERLRLFPDEPYVPSACSPGARSSNGSPLGVSHYVKSSIYNLHRVIGKRGKGEGMRAKGRRIKGEGEGGREETATTTGEG